MKNFLLIGSSLFIFFNSAFGQQINGSKYPLNYFRNPLGIHIALTANFGELRSNHWHMGFDMRTNQRENYPVFAAAEGYVSQIGIRPLSFGRFMIIKHPNGYSTLYAHLNEFYPELEKFVSKKQQEKQSWAIELEFSEKMFVVKKGDQIAKSGNTGGSQGPHLHFEILNTLTGRSLNTSLFGFDIKDDVPPVIKRLAVYDRGTSTYFQSPKLISTHKTVKGYFLKPLKILTGNTKLSFAIEAIDQVSGAAGANGIYGAILYVDNRPQIQFLIDNMNYRESEFVNAHIDWRHKYNGGTYLQHLSRLPGYTGRVYMDISSTGIIELKDTAVHSVKIEVFDTNDNRSVLFFDIQFSDSLARLQKRTAAGKQLIPGKINSLKEKEFETTMPENSFYDTLPLVYFRHNIFLPAAVSAQHRLNDPQYPVHTPITVRIKPTAIILDSLREKVLMQREWNGRKTVKKVQWQNGWAIASFGDFGNFQLFLDETDPELKPPVTEKDTMDFSSLTRIKLTPTDNFGIKSFRAELNGKWLKFTNDKARDFIYIFDEQCPYGTHQLKVRVEDLVGNFTEKIWWFKRNPYKPPVKKKPVRKKPTVSGKTVIKKK
ncbi:MAG TPA: M23 family metallopeptidase [Chitinophagaceae bacterium]|nr:M23 family metallopeptidase [Chitinophagaceae bacterium]